MEDYIYKCYSVHYSYGTHHLNLDVPSYEFQRVIDSLSEEFEIYKESESWESHDFKNCICIETYYFIDNYYGDKVQIGEIFERKLKDDFKA